MKARHHKPSVKLSKQEKLLIAAAEDNILLFNAHNNHNLLMQHVFDEHDIVKAVVRDNAQPTGFNIFFVKGLRILTEAHQRHQDWQGTITALYFDTFDDAEAMRLMFGDGRPQAAND